MAGGPVVWSVNGYDFTPQEYFDEFGATREERAEKILEDWQLQDQGGFVSAPSQTRYAPDSYTVLMYRGRATSCTCIDFNTYGPTDSSFACKHMLACEA